jgi:murein DD-endopeptidase MepM/ murein hydrolase activator NlpD
MQEKREKEQQGLTSMLQANAGRFHLVVPLEKSDRLLKMDFTASNTELTDEVLNNTERFTDYVNAKIRNYEAKYGIGGYGEHRTIYSRSKVFDMAPQIPEEGDALTQPLLMPDVVNSNDTSPVWEKSEEPRRLHLGTDIWGKPYTKVMAPLDGIVHSFAFNNAYGDYGATIILTHNLDGQIFHTLYGHLSLNSLKNLQGGERISRGDVFCEFGIPFENGQWPPHLHFQIIEDMQGLKGDYPGVCRFSEREKYLANCPDADLILGMMQLAT